MILWIFTVKTSEEDRGSIMKTKKLFHLVVHDTGNLCTQIILKTYNRNDACELEDKLSMIFSGQKQFQSEILEEIEEIES